jgi:hypothetical protein
MLVHFMTIRSIFPAIWYILWPFWIVYGHLVFFRFWYVVLRKILQPWFDTRRLFCFCIYLRKKQTFFLIRVKDWSTQSFTETTTGPNTQASRKQSVSTTPPPPPSLYHSFPSIAPPLSLTLPNM